MSSTTTARSPFGSALQAFSLLGHDPTGAARSCPVVCAFTAVSAAFTADLQVLQAGNQLGRIVAAFVDNSDASSSPVTLYLPDTAQMIFVPAQSQGFFPLLTNGLVCLITSHNFSQDYTTTINFLNFVLPPAIWSTS